MATRLQDPRRTGLTFQQSDRWVRGVHGAQTIVDSRHPLLVWEPARPIVSYAFPRSEVRADLLTPAKPPVNTIAGAAEQFDLTLGKEVLKAAAWSWPDPELGDHVAVVWRALEHWYEEDEEVFAHARDPYHRVDALKSSRHVEVSLAGRIIAATNRPVLLFETTLPVRYYVPLADVVPDLLLASHLHTGCPYKGRASYFHLRGEHEEGRHDDLAWFYTEPLPGLEALRGTVAFFNEHVDITVDGEHQPKPQTPWSKT